MRLVRFSVLLLSVAAFSVAAGCGSKAHKKGHATEDAAPAVAPPTPDTTPIEALRTPAGLVLKLDAPTPPPSATTPAPPK